MQFVHTKRWSYNQILYDVSLDGKQSGMISVSSKSSLIPTFMSQV